MKQKLLKIVTVVMLIMTLTLANFLLLCVDVVSYAVAASTNDNSTNHKNIDFMAYFNDEKGNKVTSIDTSMDNDNLRLHFQISVRKEGYFNGSISLKTSNFKFNLDNSSSDINQIDENTIILNQINAGDVKDIDVKIDVLKDDKFDLSLIDLESEIEISGIYRDSTEKDIKVKATKKLSLNLVSPYNDNDEAAILRQEVITNKVLNYNGEDKRVIQIQVNSGIEGNLFPVKSSSLELKAPKISDKYPETVLVSSIDVLASTGKMVSNSDYKYDSENGIVNIDLNNVSEDNKVNWLKTGEDVFTVTYIFDATDEVKEQVSKMDLSLSLYDKNNTVMNVSSDIDLNNEVKDSVVTLDTKQSEKSVYKGKLYEGIERDISYSTYINVNLANSISYVDVVEGKEVFEGEGLNAQVNSTYKTTQIKMSELQDVLGQDGIVTILNAENGEQISTVSKDSDVDENGFVNLVYSGNVRQIEIKTTKPQKIGRIEVKNVKTINKIDSDLIRIADNIKYNANGKYFGNGEEVDLKECVSNVELKDTETSATLEVNKDSLSTMTTNSNVEFRVILKSKNENNELFKNPTIRIELPEKIENIEITSINLLYEDELKIASKVLNGNVIEIALSGEQTKYKEEAIDGATLIINTNLTVNKRVSSSAEQVKLTYSNEKVKNYKDSANIGQEQQDINIVSYVGLITINKVDDYGIEVINNEGSKNARLKINDEARNVQITSEIINNVGSAINDVNILGVFPTKDAIKDVNNIETDVVNTINVQGIDEGRVKVYYSSNADATIDLKDSANLWKDSIEETKNVKKYLVVIDKLDVYEQVDLSYVVGIPEGLEYNAVAEYGYGIYYTNTETTIRESVTLDNLNLETGKGPVVDTSLKAYVGNREADKVKEGEIVTYQITVANTGTEEAKDIKSVGKIPENTSYLKANEVGYEMSNEEIDFTPFSTYSDIQNVGLNIDSLAVGESVTKTYKVKVNDDTEGKTISNDIETTYGEVSKASNKVASQVESGDLRLELYCTDIFDNNKVELENGYSYRYVLNVQNASNKDRKNIRIDVNADNVIDIEQIFYMTADNECITEENNRFINIDNIPAKAQVEVCVVVKAKNVTNGPAQDFTISASAVENNVTYYSNVEELTVKPINVQTSISSENSDDYVSGGDIIEYAVTLKNNGENDLSGIKIENVFSDKTTFTEVTKNGEVVPKETYLQSFDGATGDDVVTLSDGLGANEQTEYRIKAEVNRIPGNMSSVEIANNIKVYADSIEIDSAEVKHILGPEVVNSDDDNSQDVDNSDNDNNDNSNNDNIDSDNNGNNDINNNDGQDNDETNNNDKNDNNVSSNTNIRKSISGVIWLDENEDGLKGSNEKLLENVNVRLLDTKTNTFVKDRDGKELSSKTNESGFYSFDAIEKGEYIVIFEYDTSKYILTSYQKEGAVSKNASKAINRTISIDGTEKTVGATEIIKLNENNISNINVGLQNAKNFDLKLDKYISKVVIQNSKGTSTKEYTNTNFAKAEIDSKLMSGTTAIVEYTIKVTNVGDTEAYVKKVADYISKDYKFSSDLNKDWYQSGSTLYNSSLANKKLKAGESKEIKLVVTKQMTENNTGLVNNTAEIVESYNELGLKDKSNNNKAAADLILSIKTGQIATTVTLILVSIIVIGAVTYVVATYILKRRFI